MVTGNDHFMEMRRSTKQWLFAALEEIRLGEISGVNQKIAVWNLWLGVVRI
jgi:hypothetical protein